MSEIHISYIHMLNMLSSLFYYYDRFYGTKIVMHQFIYFDGI
jgi:hypothetical protein